jgi:hypothetical protein
VLRGVTLGETTYAFTSDPAEVEVTPTSYHRSSQWGKRAVLVFGTDAQRPGETLGRKVGWLVKTDGTITHLYADGFDERHRVVRRFDRGTGRHVVTLHRSNGSDGTSEQVERVVVRTGRR